MIRTRKQFIGWSVAVIGAALLITALANVFLEAKAFNALMRDNGIVTPSVWIRLRALFMNPWLYIYGAIIASGIAIIIRNKRQNDMRNVE